MSKLTSKNIPLSLYIHIPWCVKKCPYCDFNSHQMKDTTEQEFEPYVDALIADAQSQVDFVQGREILTIFIGGGTPSLLPIDQYQRLFTHLKQIFNFHKDIEVTMEANPATIEHAPFEQYLQVGINRLSIGVQTFDSEILTTLGRIHDDEQAIVAVKSARKAGFQRVNVDLMHGLPNQSLEQALFDVEQAINIGATHISWYQLTIEPNTVFYRNQPVLPTENILGDIEELGRKKLIDAGFTNYEVSAWRGSNDKPCRHNINYWQFGDYLAIGAGAHGKVTLTDVADYDDGIYRYHKPKTPRDYMRYDSFPKMAGWQAIKHEELAGEFMLDALRLNEGISLAMFSERTGLAVECISDTLDTLIHLKLLMVDNEHIQTTELGKRYLNRVVSEFI